MVMARRSIGDGESNDEKSPLAVYEWRMPGLDSGDGATKGCSVLVVPELVDSTRLGAVVGSGG
jgi:hypothetical protein